MTIYCFPWGPLRDTTGMIRQHVLLLWEEEEESLGIYCSLVISRCTSRGLCPRDARTCCRLALKWLDIPVQCSRVFLTRSQNERCESSSSRQGPAHAPRPHWS